MRVQSLIPTVSAASVRYWGIPPILNQVLAFRRCLTPVIYTIPHAVSLTPLMPFIVADLNTLLYNKPPFWEAFGAMAGTAAFVVLAGALIFEPIRWSFADDFCRAVAMQL
jgi:hypothetical protein